MLAFYGFIYKIEGFMYNKYKKYYNFLTAYTLAWTGRYAEFFVNSFYYFYF